MSTIYFDGYDENGLKDALHRMCECGHESYEHANTWNGNEEFSYLRVLQCVMCDCKEFKEKSDDKT